MSIYVIDDHPLMRDAVSMVLRRVRPAANIVELDRLSRLPGAITKHGAPTLFCLDLNLPDATGCDGVISLKGEFSDVPLAVYSASPAEDMEQLCLASGADVYIDKATGSSQLADSLRALLSEEIDTDDTPANAAAGKLTKRQVQLVECIALGFGNREIAEYLQISEHTIKVHMYRLFKRIGVTSRTQALHYARTHGYLPSRH
ncbi:MAG: response regulator transcription factor [Variovorax sp.]|nr:response regulator transcription factor [Variovorax sp.]